MENTVNVSANIIKDIDNKIKELKEIKNKEQQNVLDKKNAFTQDLREDSSEERIFDNKNDSFSRMRVYELARELNISSKDLLYMLKEIGYSVSNHMNMLDSDTINIVRNIVSEKNCNEKIYKEDSNADLLQDMDTVSIDNTINTKKEEQYSDFLVRQEIVEAVNASEENTENVQIEKCSEKPMCVSFEELRNAHPYIAVKSMYEKGYEIWEIAKILNRGQGEVSLMLNISNKKSAI